MKKVLVLLALTTVFVSCSDDDSTPAPETPFFNLLMAMNGFIRGMNKIHQQENTTLAAALIL